MSKYWELPAEESRRRLNQCLGHRADSLPVDDHMSILNLLEEILRERNVAALVANRLADSSSVRDIIDSVESLGTTR